MIRRQTGDEMASSRILEVKIFMKMYYVDSPLNNSFVWFQYVFYFYDYCGDNKMFYLLSFEC